MAIPIYWNGSQYETLGSESVPAFIISSIQPDDPNMFWIDSANDNIIKYHNGTAWVPARIAWGE